VRGLLLLRFASFTFSSSFNNGSARFSQTDLWRAFVSEVTAQRVVNGKHRDGSLFPVLLTSSAVSSAEGRVELFALVFEELSLEGATLTCAPDGLVRSTTRNVESVISLSASDLVGQSLHRFVRGAGGADVLQAARAAASISRKSGSSGSSGSCVSGARADVFGIPRQFGAPGFPLSAQLIDEREDLIVISLFQRNPLARKEATPGAVEDAIDASARGGVNQTEVREKNESQKSTFFFFFFFFTRGLRAKKWGSIACPAPWERDRAEWCAAASTAPPVRLWRSKR
jgi:hypothetical protein